MNSPAATPLAGASPQLPHDIRPLLPYHPTFWDYAPQLALGAAILATVLLAVYLWRKRHVRPVPVPPVDPWVVLFAKLQSLVVTHPFSAPAAVEYYFQLSLLLREAIERRTAVPATDRTLHELRAPLRKKLPLATDQIEAVLAFLERSDMVKFAGFTATPEEAAAAKERVCAWVSGLKPAAVVPTPLEQREARP